MDTPPPIPEPSPATGSRTFFHRCATAGLVFLAVSVLISTSLSILRPEAPSHAQAIVSLIVSLLALLLFLAGFLSGIIALCGIPRHGTRGLLIKGLAAVLTPALLTALAIPALTAATAKARTLQAQRDTVLARLSDIAAQINKDAPLMIDDDTRLDGAAVLDDGRLAYRYTLVSLQRSDIAPDQFIALLRPGILDAYKNRPEMKPFRDEKIPLVFQYRDQSGALVAEIPVGPSDL